MLVTEKIPWTPVLASRPRDLEDVQSLLSNLSGFLDLDHIRRELKELTSASDGKIESFERLLREMGGA